jgi:ankyrin repeat protein
MVDHLLDKHGMNIETHNKTLRELMFMRDSGTPIHCAVHYNNLATLEQLLARGADPESGVNYAIGNFLFTSYLPALAPLLEAGANADRALDRAVGSKNVEAAKICLAHGADLSRVMEEQRARAIRVQARRKAFMSDTWDEDELDEDSHSSEEDEKRRKKRTAMIEFLHSAERTRGLTPED